MNNKQFIFNSIKKIEIKNFIVLNIFCNRFV